MESINVKSSSIPVFSRYHPVIPKRYTPAFKHDMKNRNLIVENCKIAGLHYGPEETSLYLEKRERFSCAEPRERVKAKSLQIPRDLQLRPSLYSPLSKYQSSLSFRTSSS
ncbi:sperm-associated microtubule inner protein 10-like [Rhopilema esculentum]|uniref:sperm-associated microtubule inner protein 10-like n=1 Tax=Rhopilema esculentum TaxID=499914 RepID=UPI0031D1CA86